MKYAVASINFFDNELEIEFIEASNRDEALRNSKANRIIDHKLEEGEGKYSLEELKQEAFLFDGMIDIKVIMIDIKVIE